MADFSSGINPVTPQQTYVPTAPANDADANAISSVANIAGAVGKSLVGGYDTAQVNALTSRQNTYKSNFTQNLIRISDLEAQGAIKPETAASQYRLQMARALTAHPELEKDFLQIHSDVVGNPLLGGNVARDVQQQKDNANTLMMGNLKAAQDAGWGNAQMPMDQQIAWSQKHQQFLYAQGQVNAALDLKQKQNAVVSSGLAITSAKNSIALQGLSYQKAKIDLDNAKADQQFVAGVKNLNDAYFTKFNSDMGMLVSSIQSGKMKKEDAIALAQQQFAGIQEQVSGLAMAHKDPDYINSFMAPYKMLLDSTIDKLSGKTLNTVATNEVSNIQALHETQLLTSDPAIAKLAAVSNVFKTGLGPMGQVIQDTAGNILKRAVGTDPTLAPPNVVGDGTPESNAGTKQYFGILKRAMIAEPTANDQPLTDEVQTHAQQVFKGLTVYGPTASSPTQLNEAVKYFASPEFGSYIKAHPDTVTGDNAQKAEDTYRKYYQTQVLPLIQKEFIDTGVSFSDAETVTGYKPSVEGGLAARAGNTPKAVVQDNAELIQPYFNGVNVSFKLKSNAAGVANSPNVQAKLTQLNKQVAPVMNMLIRANAHFAGGNNYQKAYVELLKELSPSEDTTP